MMEFIWLMATVFIIAIIFGIMQGRSNNKKRNEMVKEIQKLDDFDVSHSYMEANAINGIALDNSRHKFCLIVNELGKYNLSVYSYKDLLEVEVLEDGGSITKTARGSQLGGMLIGGLALGGVGAIVGGLSGQKNNIDKIKSMDLKLVINNIDNPLFIINFFKSVESKGSTRSGLLYNNSNELIKEWHSRLSVLIKKADEEDKKSEKIKNTNSVADELIKLKELLKEEIISQDEFDKQKEKILNT